MYVSFLYEAASEAELGCAYPSLQLYDRHNDYTHNVVITADVLASKEGAEQGKGRATNVQGLNS